MAIVSLRALCLLSISSPSNMEVSKVEIWRCSLRFSNCWWRSSWTV